MDDDRDRLERARAWFEEGLSIAEEIGDPSSRVNHLHGLASVAELEGDVRGARRLYERSLDVSRGFGGITYEAWSLTGLGFTDVSDGRHEDAWARGRQALALFRRAKIDDVFDVLGLLAAAARGLGRLEDAVRLVAAGYRSAEAGGVAIPPMSRARLDGVRDEVRPLVDAEAFERVWSEGRALTSDDILARYPPDA